MTESTPTAPRLLCVYAHPDDEVFCSGGTIAKNVAAGAEVLVVSATKGDAGQIRDADVATRRTLGAVRELELQESCRRLGAHQAVCWDYGDGKLKDEDPQRLLEDIVEVIREFRPDVVITFGPDGAYGHPDHIVIGQATTIACQVSGDPHSFPAQMDAGLEPHAPQRLYHSHFPPNRMVMVDRLSRWLMDTGDEPKDLEFVRAMLLFAEGSTTMKYTSDRHDVNWYPAGSYIIEQGEVARDLYLVLSGSAKAVREEDDGTLIHRATLGPGAFFGEIGIATRQRRMSHVIAEVDVTCLILSMTEAVNFGGRGGDAAIHGGQGRVADDAEAPNAGQRLFTTCIDVSDHVYAKVSAMAAHRSQYPILPDMFPMDMLTEMMGKEYFVRVLPRPQVEDAIFPYESTPKVR